MTEPSRVVFRKQVSDGNYGSEVAEVALETSPGLEAMTLAHARDLVHAELARSPSGTVRRALESPKLATAPNIDDDDENLEDLPL